MSAAFTLAVLLAVIVMSDWLARNTALRHAGTALLVIVFSAALANVGVIPTASNASPLYAGVFHYVAPLAIFLLLLQVDLGRLRQAGLAMLLAFAIGSAATVAGVLAGLWLTPVGTRLGELTPALGGMFAATYTGGSINFNAIALHYQVNEQGALYAGALAVDNIMTMAWMVVTLLVPRVFGRLQRGRETRPVSASGVTRESIDLPGVCTVLALAAVSLWAAERLAQLLASTPVPLPSILILTTIALALAQLRWVRETGGTHVLGLLAVYLFLAVIGAHAEFAALREIGGLAVSLLLFVTVLLTVHGVILFGLGRFFDDWPLIAIASQANIGGATTAMALAETFDREDLLFPAILVGSLGTATGTYLGFAVAAML